MFGRKRAIAAPARRPHPDPRTETRLQRIISLRESASRKADLSRQYAEEIRKLSGQYRAQAANGYGSRASDMESRLKDLQRETRQLETEIDGIHEEIAKRTEELDDADLSYL